jgi:hypothetical protein
VWHSLGNPALWAGFSKTDLGMIWKIPGLFQNDSLNKKEGCFRLKLLLVLSTILTVQTHSETNSIFHECQFVGPWNSELANVLLARHIWNHFLLKSKIWVKNIEYDSLWTRSPNFSLQIQVLSLVNAISEFAIFAILYENRKSFRTFLFSKNIQTFWTRFVWFGI